MKRWLITLIFSLNAILVYASEKSDTDKLLRGDLLFPPPLSKDLSNDKKLFALDDAMREYLDKVAIGRSPSQRFIALINDLRDRNFTLKYELNQTATASEAFSKRQGNCVSFAAMIVSFAREIGLKSYMNRAPLKFDKQLLIRTEEAHYVQNIMHINAVIEAPGPGRIMRRFTVEDDLGIRRGKELSKLRDSEARAIFHNNLAMEAMFENDLAGAFHHSRQAIQLDSDASYLWSGLGTIYRRAGAFPLAESSFKHALTLDKEDSTARKNLFLLTEARKEKENYVKKESTQSVTDA